MLLRPGPKEQIPADLLCSCPQRGLGCLLGLFTRVLDVLGIKVD